MIAPIVATNAAVVAANCARSNCEHVPGWALAVLLSALALTCLALAGMIIEMCKGDL